MFYRNRCHFMRALVLSLSIIVSTASGMGAKVRHDQLCIQTHLGHPGWESLSVFDSNNEMGVGWIRDELFWSHTETEKGVYKIPDYTWEWIKAARAKDLKIILILNGSNKIYEDPYDHDGYVEFARFVAKEMRGYVQAIELINEPFGRFRNGVEEIVGGPASWNGWDPETKSIEPWVKRYLKMMNAMADAIEEVAPGEYDIIGLGCSAPLNKLILTLGVSQNVDGIVAHPYSYRSIPELQPYNNTPERVERDGIEVGDEAGNFVAINEDALAFSMAHGGPDELWLTEQGYTTFQPKNTKSHYYGFTEDAQAKYAQRRLMECLGTNVRMASWYNFYSKGDRRDNSEDNFGVMRRDGSLKPAYYAIQAVATTMIYWQPDDWGQVDVYFYADRLSVKPYDWKYQPAGLDEVRAYTFKSTTGDDLSVALWSVEPVGGDLQPRRADVAIACDREVARVSAKDMMSGEVSELNFELKDGKILIQDMVVPAYPVLLVLE